MCSRICTWASSRIRDSDGTVVLVFYEGNLYLNLSTGHHKDKGRLRLRGDQKADTPPPLRTRWNSDRRARVGPLLNSP